MRMHVVRACALVACSKQLFSGLHWTLSLSLFSGWTKITFWKMHGHMSMHFLSRVIICADVTQAACIVANLWICGSIVEVYMMKFGVHSTSLYIEKVLAKLSQWLWLDNATLFLGCSSLKGRGSWEWLPVVWVGWGPLTGVKNSARGKSPCPSPRG